MVSRNRTVAEKTTDFMAAFNVIRSEVTPEVLRKLLDVLTVGDATTPEEAIAILTQSMNLARLVSANDRMAAVAAAILTSSGGARPVVVDEL